MSSQQASIVDLDYQLVSMSINLKDLASGIRQGRSEFEKREWIPKICDIESMKDIYAEVGGLKIHYNDSLVTQQTCSVRKKKDSRNTCLKRSDLVCSIERKY
jgi:hypothetical protein